MKTAFGVGLALAAGVAFAAAGLPALAQDRPQVPGFVKFNVADQDKMLTFYQKAFGATVQKVAVDSPQLKEIILNNPKGMDLALVFFKDGRKIAIGSAEGPIGFYLKDAKAVDDAYASAMAAGATSKSKPGGAGGLRVATVADPEGHEIELLHLP
jgi:uncharacterized glyoxalase superfamily protein PhnB